MNLLMLFGVGLGLIVSGVVVGRLYMPDRRPLRRAADESRRFARGLVEWLEGDSEAAVAEISQALRYNRGNLDAFFALGTLFRKRGEFERAVRVHQSLLVRRDLDKRTKVRVHYQLAQDFLEAGFLRRAEQALEWVVTRDPGHREALQQLGAVLERVGNLRRAILVYGKLAKLTKAKRPTEIGHLMAHVAEMARKLGETKMAARAAKRALNISPRSAHVLATAADVEADQGRFKRAQRLWEQCVVQRPGLVGLALGRQSVFPTEQEQRELVDTAIAQHPDDPQLQLLVARFESAANPSLARSRLAEVLQRFPDLLPARRDAARLALNHESDPTAIRDALGALVGALEGVEQAYLCEECQRTTALHFWRCSNCGRWETATRAWGRRSGEDLRATKRT